MTHQLSNESGLTGTQWDHPLRSTKVAEPESFDGSRDETEQFVCANHITVTMQLDTFMDKRMEILYVFSFRHGGMAQVWL